MPDPAILRSGAVTASIDSQTTLQKLGCRQYVQERVCTSPYTSCVAATHPSIRINAGAKTKVKSSVQRGIRTKITETYPLLEPHIEEIIPKKSQLDLLKL